MKLFHYTCAHAKPQITNRGMLRPTPQPVLNNVAILWLTDQAQPIRVALGLTSTILDCDRLAYRYIVDVDDAERWDDVREEFPLEGRTMLECEPGADPSAWWLVRHSCLGVLDRTYSAKAQYGITVVEI